MKHYIGIDLDQSYMRAGVVDEKGHLLCKESIRTRADRKANEIVRDIAYLAQNAIKTSKIPWSGISSVGIGFPGIPDNDSGVMMHPLGLPLHNTNIRSDIQRIVPLPVHIENNANCTALAESILGAAKGMDHSITITIGTDVTGGVIINRRIYSGFNHAGAEPGHFILFEDGEPCRCGRNGCFAAYASTEALRREVERAARKKPNSILNSRLTINPDESCFGMLSESMLAGDEAARSVAEKYIHSVSAGLATILRLFMPEAILLDGEICGTAEFWLPLIENEIEKIRPNPVGIRKPRILAAKIGEDKGILGAAMMAMLSEMDDIRGD